jgi:hypothetical protein
VKTSLRKVFAFFQFHNTSKLDVFGISVRLQLSGFSGLIPVKVRRKQKNGTLSSCGAFRRYRSQRGQTGFAINSADFHFSSRAVGGGILSQLLKSCSAFTLCSIALAAVSLVFLNGHGKAAAKS